MTKIFKPAVLQDSLLCDFQHIEGYKLSDSTSKEISILSILLFLLSAFVFMVLSMTIGKIDRIFSQEIIKIGIWEAAVSLAAIPATIFLHELVHGLAMRMFGARPQYGFILKPFAFFVTAPGYGFRRNVSILVEIAPFVLLSSLAVLGMIIFQGTIWVPLLAVCATLNASGAAADVWMITKVLRHSGSVYIIDERDGFKVLTLTEHVIGSK